MLNYLKLKYVFSALPGQGHPCTFQSTFGQVEPPGKYFLILSDQTFFEGAGAGAEQMKIGMLGGNYLGEMRKSKIHSP